DQDGNDGNDDEQFDQRETRTEDASHGKLLCDRIPKREVRTPEAARPKNDPIRAPVFVRGRRLVTKNNPRGGGQIAGYSDGDENDGMGSVGARRRGRAMAAGDVRGRHADFAEHLRQSQTRLYGYIHSLVRDLNDADDLFQQTSLILWKKFDEYDP